MKKLIAISVVFALVAGAAFAVDLSGSVVGNVDVLKGSTAEGSEVSAGGKMGLIRLDGAGESGDGDFGGYIRVQGDDFSAIDAVTAWWKPIDQFKLTIGGNGDGFWGKEGVTGWMFNQKANDGDFATNYGIWYGPGWNSSVFFGGAPMCNRYTFFEGFVGMGALLEITPADIASINVAIPFFNAGYNQQKGEELKVADTFKDSVAQVSLNLDFGNIAITYDGGGRAVAAVSSPGAIYVYFGGSFGDLGLDVGLSYHLTGDAAKGETEEALPIGIGAGVKYATDSLGVKFRVTAALAGSDKGEFSDATYINTSVLPYFILGDNLAAFVHVGLGLALPSEGDSVIGWFFNPYLRVGAEWGPTFYAGIRAASQGSVGGADAVINWEVPIAINVSF